MQTKNKNKHNFTNRGQVATICLLVALFVFTFLPSVQAIDVSASVTDQELDSLQGEIKDKQSQIEELRRQSDQYERSLSRTRNKIDTLEGQINNIDNIIAKLQIEIQTTDLEIEEVNLQMKNLEYSLEKANQEIDDSQDRITTILQQLNRNSYQSNMAQILVSQKTIGDFFESINQLNKITTSLQDQLNELTDKKTELARQQNLLQQKKDKLDELSLQLAANKEKLDREKNVKDDILAQTQGEESKYQSLLEELRAEQKRINNEIYSLEIEARKKLYELKGEDFLSSEKGYIWPVSSRRVTAYFHDPDYPYRHIFEHPAIDIGSTPQGTPVRAVKSGYVAKVRDTGQSGGYNYIMLIHSDGISSVYGHMNRMTVAEDTFVVQGEIIGYSGGMPGTAGAGNLTSGPHLHLEVRKNGIPVNPLNYLP